MACVRYVDERGPCSRGYPPSIFGIPPDFDIGPRELAPVDWERAQDEDLARLETLHQRVSAASYSWRPAHCVMPNIRISATLIRHRMADSLR